MQLEVSTIAACFEVDFWFSYWQMSDDAIYVIAIGSTFMLLEEDVNTLFIHGTMNR